MSFSTDPYGIVGGPDGNLWFTAYGTNMIDVMSTSGTIVHQYPVPVPSGIGGGAQLADITVGSDKNLYFTEQIGDIGEITTSGVVTITPVSTTIPTVPGEPADPSRSPSRAGPMVTSGSLTRGPTALACSSLALGENPHLRDLGLDGFMPRASS